MNLLPIIEKRLKRSLKHRADKLQLISNLQLPSDLIHLIKQFYFDTIKAKADNDRDVVNYLFTFGRFAETTLMADAWFVNRKITISDEYGYAHISCQVDRGNDSQGPFHYELKFVKNSKVVKRYWRGHNIVRQKIHSWGSNICISCGNFIGQRSNNCTC